MSVLRMIQKKLRQMRKERPDLPAGLEVSAWDGWGHKAGVVVGPAGRGMWLVRIAGGVVVTRVRHNILTAEERAASRPSGLRE